MFIYVFFFFQTAALTQKQTQIVDRESRGGQKNNISFVR